MKKIHMKILIDILMTILFICLTKIKITGMHMHEVLGIIVTLFVIIHLVLNFSWVKAITLKIFDKNLNYKIKITYWINVLLAILVCTIFISGILVSVTIFTNISTANRGTWAFIHRKAALITFILIIVHALLNIKMIKGHCKKMYKIVKYETQIK